MLWVHRGLLLTAALFLALSSLYAVRALTVRPQRVRRATRAATVLLVLLILDSLGRVPVTLRAAENTGDPRQMFWAILDVCLRNGAPIFLWGLALFGRWRGWLADTVLASALLIAAAATLLLYGLPLPGRFPF